MPATPHVPAIAGAAQVIQRPGELPLEAARGPIELMVDAARAAADDAGAPGLLARVGWVAVVPGIYHWNDPGAIVAERLGCRGAASALSGMSGTSGQDLLGLACARIAAGQLDVALIAGGEARWTARRLKALGQQPGWRADDTSTEPERLFGFPDEMLTEMAALGAAAVGYALLEDRLRSAAGETPAEHAARIAKLWEGFSAVASQNPYAWDPSAHSAESIVTPSPSNRMICHPYTKAMVANNQVDMASALLVCSEQVAREAGVSNDRLVFPHVVTRGHETWRVAERRELHQSPALVVAGQAAFAHAGVGPSEIEHVDLYACFPSIVQMSSAALGLTHDRPLTLTGGLGFAGASIANAVGQSLAAMVPLARAGGWALVHGNGGTATKQSFGIYRNAPPAAGFAELDVQDRVDLAPRDVLPEDWSGACIVEAATVVFDREGPARLLAAVLDEAGARAWATSTDLTLCEQAMSAGIDGVAAKRSAAGELLL
jgi:acetyl-CoA C-acetyltransferase